MADKHQVGEELRALLEAVKKYPVSPRIYKYCVAFRPQFDWTLSIFTVYPHDNHFWFKVYPWNFDKYRGADPERVRELFGEEHWQRKEKADVTYFIENLIKFFSDLD